MVANVIPELVMVAGNSPLLEIVAYDLPEFILVADNSPTFAIVDMTQLSL